MNYKIIGQTVPSVEINLNQGEKLFTQSGGMAWQSDGIAMETNTRGGLFKGLGRMLAGESMFMAHYTATKNNAYIGFSSTVPGSIVAVDVSSNGNNLII